MWWFWSYRDSEIAEILWGRGFYFDFCCLGEKLREGKHKHKSRQHRGINGLCIPWLLQGIGRMIGPRMCAGRSWWMWRIRQTIASCKRWRKSTRTPSQQKPQDLYQAWFTEPFHFKYKDMDPTAEVMHLVFLQRFLSPQEWHRARQAYARSTAVSSIVGFGSSCDSKPITSDDVNELFLVHIHSSFT